MKKRESAITPESHPDLDVAAVRVEVLRQVRAILADAGDPRPCRTLDETVFQSFGFDGWPRKSVLAVVRAILEHAPVCDLAIFWRDARQYKASDAECIVGDMERAAEQPPAEAAEAAAWHARWMQLGGQLHAQSPAMFESASALFAMFESASALFAQVLGTSGAEGKS